jgi:hypothetical protein
MFLPSFTYFFHFFLIFIYPILPHFFLIVSFSFQMKHIMVIFNCITVQSRTEWRRKNALTQFLKDTLFETQQGCLLSCPRFLIYLQAYFEILT